ncbi:MAG: hypothetical protein Q9219_003109 [cf. Caloplaca sp. 3 TL-2023]
MGDNRGHGTSKKPISDQAERHERPPPSKSSARVAQPSQPSLPPTRSPDGSIPSPLLSQPTSSNGGAKVPIPRLRRATDGSSRSKPSTSFDSKHRVTHACEPCRQRKTKCSGERPVCKHCEDFRIACVYADGKRDRTKREYNIMAAQVADYKDLLQDLSDRVCDEDQLRIQKLLGADDRSLHEEDANQATSWNSATPDGIGISNLVNEHRATGRAGSAESLDCINEDFNTSAASRSTGFMGKSSDVRWMEGLLHETDAGNDHDEEGVPQMKFGPGLDQIYEDGVKDPKKTHLLSESSYYCDDVPPLIHGGDGDVQAYQLPPRNIADILLTYYMDTVHPVFPILGKTTFLKQYQAIYANPNLNPGPKWLSVLNLVFALGARYSELIRAEWGGFVEEPHVYFSRAWLLGLDVDSLWSHAEMQRIQITALASFYLMATYQINR